MADPGRSEADAVSLPSVSDLERAITSVIGVASAEVARSGTGRDRLRISLTPGADPEAAAWAVAATLRERFAIALDPAAIVARHVETAPGTLEADPSPSGGPEAAGSDEAGPDQDPAAVPEAARSDTADVGSGVEGGPTHADVQWPPRRGPAVAQPERPEPVDRPGRHGAIATSGAQEHAPSLVAPEGEHASPDLLAAARAVIDEAATGAASQPPASGPASGDPGPAVTTVERHLRVEPAAAGARPGREAGVDLSRRRAAIGDLVARPVGDDLDISATLTWADAAATGRARGLRTRRGRWRAIAEATLDALRDLTAGRLRADVDHVSILTLPELAHVTVSVTLVTERGEETFLGAALVRDDPDQAVMRATMDAVNRRVEPWLGAADRV